MENRLFCTADFVTTNIVKKIRKGCRAKKLTFKNEIIQIKDNHNHI